MRPPDRDRSQSPCVDSSAIEKRCTMRKWIPLFRSARRARSGTWRHRFRPVLEILEARRLLAGYLQTNLIADTSGIAALTDPNLANPWGLAAVPFGPWWVADNNGGGSSFYDLSNASSPVLDGFVGVPLPGSPPQPGGAPTGAVANDTTGFAMSSNPQNPEPAQFIFSTEDGTIAAWNPNVNLDQAVIEVDNSTNTDGGPAGSLGAVYKGLALGGTSSSPLLFATNFRSGEVDVFNSSFQQINKFTDPG